MDDSVESLQKKIDQLCFSLIQRSRMGSNVTQALYNHDILNRLTYGRSITKEEEEEFLQLFYDQKFNRAVNRLVEIQNQVVNGGTLFFGSPNHIDDGKTINPTKSSYLSQNVVVATNIKSLAFIFIARWGRDDLELGQRSGKLYLKEKYDGAFEKVFKGVSGFVYTVKKSNFQKSSDLPLRGNQFVSYDPVEFIKRQRIENVWGALSSSSEVNLIWNKEPLENSLTVYRGGKAYSVNKQGKVVVIKNMYGDKYVKHTKFFHVTAKQINAMQPGDKTFFVFFDRNLCDYLGSHSPKFVEWKLYKPHDVFNRTHYHGEYVHEKELKGKMKFHWKGSDNKFEDFEFDVEYQPGCWYPLENQKLEVHDLDLFLSILGFCKDCESKERNVWEINSDVFIQQNVRVGWRGPMVFEHSLFNMPDVFINKS